MNLEMKYASLLILSVILVAGCLSPSNTKPEWVHKVYWQGDKPDGAAGLEAELWAQITPYNFEYDQVNITAKKEDGGLRLRVIGTSNSIEYRDIYDFTSSKGTLICTGYLLEALPPHDRDAALAIAMQNRSIRESEIFGSPAVRRILPDTSKKYYAPKTLLSVSWKGVSALVDPQEQRVVGIWKESKSTT